MKSRKLDNLPPFGAQLTMESGNSSTAQHSPFTSGVNMLFERSKLSKRPILNSLNTLLKRFGSEPMMATFGPKISESQEWSLRASALVTFQRGAVRLQVGVQACSKPRRAKLSKWLKTLVFLWRVFILLLLGDTWKSIVFQMLSCSSLADSYGYITQNKLAKLRGCVSFESKKRFDPI